MLHALKALRKRFPELNRRAFTEDDCWSFCEREKIVVKRAALGVDGFTGFKTVGNRRRYYILLDSRLSGMRFVAAFLHEIGHYVLHEPRGSTDVLYLKRDTAPESRAELEADAFMLLALIPLKRFLEMRSTPPEMLHPFDADLLTRRERLLKLIGE